MRSKVKIHKIGNDRFLYINNKICRWDIKDKREEQEELANRAYGDVLVAGYGLGILQKYLSENEKIKSILSVEKLSCIVSRCEEEYKKIYGDILYGDFSEVKPHKEFDCVIGYIWKETTKKYLEDYKKFKEKAKKFVKPNGKIIGWGDDYFEYLIEKEKAKLKLLDIV